LIEVIVGFLSALINHKDRKSTKGIPHRGINHKDTRAQRNSMV